MFRILRDKYFLLCLTVAGILIFTGMTGLHQEETAAEEGIVHGITESSNGFLFTLDSIDGEQLRCFCRERPVSGGLYRLDGDRSADGAVFFVSVLRPLETETA